MLIKDQNFLFVTLGCRTNDFETSQIKSDVLKKGGKIATNQNNADIVIINTCCVTNKAMSKSKYFINKYNKLPNVKLIVVCGCFSQLDQNINNDKVGIIIGTKYKTNIVKLIQMYESKKIIKITDIVNEKKYEKPTDSCLQHKTRTIYKIQDGCNFNCTYCVIPAVRGRQRSLSHKIILDDIKKIIKNNVKEIVLTGVNTSGYNDGILNFYDLLNKIDKLKGNFRVRISSLEPFQVNKKIIDLITSNKKR
jgi:threonylcarbamoyladenosine tRNA methylthiotransferase MtaB